MTDATGSPSPLRFFWPLATILLIVGFGHSLLAWTVLHSAQECELNGVSCADLGTAALLHASAMPAATLLLIVLVAWRIGRWSPRLSIGLLVLALLALAGTVLVGLLSAVAA